ncbi:MAG: polyprenyl synthetase family protein [Bacteroidota bacterium]|nr:polyprenyl synthetase family protein [Bacteroidota bacterium]
MDIKSLSKPIEEDLKIFNKQFREAIRSDISYVDLITRYIVRQKGKQIRPFLVLHTAKMCGKIYESTYRGAALVEILHTATLIHDDVVDDADTRRGFASINAVWKNKIAVLVGDYLLAKGLLLSLDNRDHEFLKIISQSVRKMSEAEILQIVKSRQLDMDEKTYLKIISGKTASLLSTCTEIGAVSNEVGIEQRKLLREFGENLGFAFQIRDDLLDFIGKKSITGKPTGKDLIEKKLTLPLIHAIENAPRKQSAAVLRLIKKGVKRKDLETILEFVESYNGITYSEEKAKQYAEIAFSKIKAFPESPSKESLEKFLSFVVERIK